MPSPVVSVIIPVFNGEKTIAKNLQAAALQDFSSLMEVIVVDDGSHDQSPEIVRGFPGVKYLRQPNRGPASARNLGAQKSTGEYLFFTDADCVPRGNWVSGMLNHFSDPRVAVVAGSYGIANPDSILARCIHREIIFRHQERMPLYPKVFGSYNFAVRRAVFFEVGGFDEGYRHASGEDNDLSYKILGKGYKIYFDKGSLVDHHHPERVGKYLREQGRHGFWRVRMYARHPSMSGGDNYTFWKDMLEVPLSGLIVAGFLAWALRLPVPLLLPVAAVSGLLLMELYFSLKIQRSFYEILFWAWVSGARAFARTGGFLWGALFWPFSKKP
ncbi:MAG: glycosyltransferase [Candidatus Omnitrophota bacterium]|nr:glycosyltransferase [Candidatus Omnitrophota bacterium]MDZ4242728.1 glycosyltransferase [Candidatus Omnitrophota bacterium]